MGLEIGIAAQAVEQRAMMTSKYCNNSDNLRISFCLCDKVFIDPIDLFAMSHIT
jgi:hypothetical protein